MSEHQPERRLNNKELHDKIDALIGIMTMHVHTQETSITELRNMVDEYFERIEAHEHVYHHEYLGEEIQEKKDASAEWKKMKYSLKEKAIIFLFGAVMSYLGGVVWFDLADRLNKQDTKPAVVNQSPTTHPPLKPNETPPLP